MPPHLPPRPSRVENFLDAGASVINTLFFFLPSSTFFLFPPYPFVAQAANPVADEHNRARVFAQVREKLTCLILALNITRYITMCKASKASKANVRRILSTVLDTAFVSFFLVNTGLIDLTGFNHCISTVYKSSEQSSECKCVRLNKIALT
jgi:hypothetical protein